MCYRYVKIFRCGHKRHAPPVHCPNAIFNSATGCWSMCGSRTTEQVADPDLCGDDQCYFDELKANGWTCCRCGEPNNRMDGCIGPPGGNMSCPHFVCTLCRLS